MSSGVDINRNAVIPLWEFPPIELNKYFIVVPNTSALYAQFQGRIIFSKKMRL